MKEVSKPLMWMKYGKLVVHSNRRESTSILITGKRLKEGSLILLVSSVIAFNFDTVIKIEVRCVPPFFFLGGEVDLFVNDWRLI